MFKNIHYYFTTTFGTLWCVMFYIDVRLFISLEISGKDQGASGAPNQRETNFWIEIFYKENMFVFPFIVSAFFSFGFEIAHFWVDIQPFSKYFLVLEDLSNSFQLFLRIIAKFGACNYRKINSQAPSRLTATSTHDFCSCLRIREKDTDRVIVWSPQNAFCKFFLLFPGEVGPY